MPQYKAQQLPFEGLPKFIQDHKRMFDRERPCYPFVAKVFGANGKLIVEQVFIGPYARPKLEVMTGDDWDAPLKIEFYNGHQDLFRSHEMHWPTVKEFLQSEIELGGS